MNQQTASPSIEEWKNLYEVAVQFKKLAPWEYMFDDQLFGVKDPESGEIGYCCIMGNLGEHLALGVYLGSDGLEGYLRMLTDDVPDNPIEVLALQKCLMASFEDRGDLEKEDLSVVKKLGLKFRGSMEWPLFRSYRPGFQPWFVTGAEARFLAVALEQAIQVAERCRENPDLVISERENTYFVREAQRTEQGLEWQDAWLSPSEVQKPPLQSSSVDEERLEKIKATIKATKAKWEVDWFYFAPPVKEKTDERPYFPQALMVVDQQSGAILAMDLMKANEPFSNFADKILHLIESTEMMPGQILVQREELQTLLQPIASHMGIRISGVEYLKMVEAAQDALFSFML